MRFPFMSLILLVILTPVAQARDHGRRDRDDHHRHRASEAPRWGPRARWEAHGRWERRHHGEEAWGHRQGRHHGWERESWIGAPAPSFHVRIHLP